MEEILGQRKRPAIGIGKFLTTYKGSLGHIMNVRPEQNMQRTMPQLGGESLLNDLNARCSLKRLQQDDDSFIMKFEPGVTEFNRLNTSNISQNALKLKTLQLLLQAKETAARSPFQRSREIYKMVKLPANKETNTDNFHNDVMVTIRVYRPARATHTGQNLEKPVFAEEFECLGSNLLTELRDKISCVCRNERFFDVSYNPDTEIPQKTTDPAYFFITDTFYNDRRNPQNSDYSEVVRNWAKNAVGLKDMYFKVGKMETTRFIDLKVSLGFPQLYQHHGNCEHVFTFSQIELAKPRSLCHISHYPRLSSFGLFNNRSCNMCGMTQYSFIVEHNDRQLHDPAYICNNCFHSYNYINGKKIGNFKAYRINSFKREETKVDESEDIRYLSK